MINLSTTNRKSLHKAVMRTGSILRLVSGLVIAAPMVFHFATADMTKVGLPPTMGMADSAISSGYLELFPASFEPEPEEEDVLSQAFAANTSELLWSGTLSLASRGLETSENVRLSAEAVDLTVLRPGETFSFNGTVGIRSIDKGYLPGLMYSNGEVVTGVGGGICIVSTYLYNAALETGLKIIERHPHSGPVSYAEPGRDAAVAFGWADLRFKNNTDGLLFIRSRVENDELVVAFYGTKKPGRTVEIAAEDYEEIPYKIVEKEDETVPEGEVKVEQKARLGSRVTIVRIIREDGKVVSRETICRDTMLPRDKIVLIPPKPEETLEELPSVAPLPVETKKKPDRPASIPKTGVIAIPDTDDEPQDSPEEDSDLPGLSRPTAERAKAAASE